MSEHLPEEEPEYVKQLRAELEAKKAQCAQLQAEHSRVNSQRLEFYLYKSIHSLRHYLLLAEGAVMLKVFSTAYLQKCDRNLLYFNEINKRYFTQEDWDALNANQDYRDLMQLEQLPEIKIFMEDFALTGWFSGVIGWKGVEIYLKSIESAGYNVDSWEKVKAAFDVLSKSELIERLNNDYRLLIREAYRRGEINLD